MRKNNIKAGVRTFKIAFGCFCILLTIILLIFLLPQTIFPSVDYSKRLSAHSTRHDFIYLETHSTRRGLRYRRNRVNHYIFFAEYGDRFVPIIARGARERDRIDALVSNEDYSKTVRIEGMLQNHNLSVWRAIDEFEENNGSNNIISPYTLRITTTGSVRADVIVGMLFLFTPAIYGVWNILRAVGVRK